MCKKLCTNNSHVPCHITTNNWSVTVTYTYKDFFHTIMLYKIVAVFVTEIPLYHYAAAAHQNLETASANTKHERVDNNLNNLH